MHPSPGTVGVILAAAVRCKAAAMSRCSEDRAGEVAKALEDRKLDVLRHLLPHGKIRGHKFEVGDLQGNPGESLKVSLNGKGCVWSDFATGQKGADQIGRASCRERV